MHVISASRVQVPELEVLCLPRSWDKNNADENLYGVVYCHGSGDHAGSMLDTVGKAGQSKVLRTLVDRGFPVLSMDLGQTGVTPNNLNGWGNSVVVDRIDTAFTYMTGAAVGAKAGKVILVGISMGNAGCLNYAKDNPDNVAGVVGIIPVCDIDDIYQNNRLGLRDGIGLAHGVVFPESLPAGANPATSQGDLADVPVYFTYSNGDTVIIPSTVSDLAEDIGATAVVHSESLEHSEESILAVDFDAMMSWILALT